MLMITYTPAYIQENRERKGERQRQKETESLSSDHFYKPLIDNNILL